MILDIKGKFSKIFLLRMSELFDYVDINFAWMSIWHNFFNKMIILEKEYISNNYLFNQAIKEV